MSQSQVIEKQDILLDSGTNEMEIIEFYLGGQSFGINVQKLKEIIPYNQSAVTTIPESHEYILGTLLLRGETIPLYDLKKSLKKKNPSDNPASRQVVLVCEFNDRINGFLVDDVNQIHRRSWKDICPMPPSLTSPSSRLTGTITIQDPLRSVLVVDLESIIADVDASSDMNSFSSNDALRVEEKRKDKRIFLAEDSPVVRDMIEKILLSSGYKITTFENGKQCLDVLSAEDIPDALITDIEMPQMDGLTLTKKVKQEMGIDVPIIIFSSLINKATAEKCWAVGANDCCTKPEIVRLVEKIDKLVFS